MLPEMFACCNSVSSRFENNTFSGIKLIKDVTENLLGTFLLLMFCFHPNLIFPLSKKSKIESQYIDKIRNIYCRETLAAAEFLYHAQNWRLVRA
jgi:hypothetical protein